MRRVRIRIRTARSRQPIRARLIQRRAALREPARRRTARRVADVVLRRAVAIAAEEEEIRPIRAAGEAGGFDVGPVGRVEVEKGRGSALGRHGVGADGLDHDGRVDDRVVRVAARAAVAEAVAVDLVHDVAGAVGVVEARGVDGAALVCGAGELGVVGGEGAGDGFAGRGADAVVAWCCAVAGAVVEDECAVVL